MTALVFLEPNKIDAEPFTTSDVVAEWTGNHYRSVQRIIENQAKRLEHFGVMRFEITLPSKGSKGGRPKKTYYLNEQQATLLVTFLKNTDVVADFKVGLVRQFYAMREELMRRRMFRMELKPVRRELTDTVNEKDTSRWAYKKYTDLAYKVALGKNAVQLRKERNAPKRAIAVDYMTSGEIASVTKRQYQISTLLDLGMSYEQIKAVLFNQMIAAQTA